MVLPILEEHGHPGPHCWATHTNVLKVGAHGNQWQFLSYRHHCLHEFGHAKPSGHQRLREGLLKLPVLGAPFNRGQYLSCGLLSLVTKRQQAFDSLVIQGEGSADGHGMPLDVTLGMFHHLLLQFEELRPSLEGADCSTHRLPCCVVLLGDWLDPSLLCWDGQTPGFCISCLLHALPSSCPQLLDRFLLLLRQQLLLRF